MRQVPQIATCRFCGSQIEKWSEMNCAWLHSDTHDPFCHTYTAEPVSFDDAEPMEGDCEAQAAIPIPLYYGEANVTGIRTEDRREGWVVSTDRAEGLSMWFQEMYGFDAALGLSFHLDELGTIRRGDVLTITIERKRS